MESMGMRNSIAAMALLCGACARIARKRRQVIAPLRDLRGGLRRIGEGGKVNLKRQSRSRGGSGNEDRCSESKEET